MTITSNAIEELRQAAEQRAIDAERESGRQHIGKLVVVSDASDFAVSTYSHACGGGAGAMPVVGVLSGIRNGMFYVYGSSRGWNHFRLVDEKVYS